MLVLVLATVDAVEVDVLETVDVTTVPVDFNLSADTEEMISTLDTVADEINSSLSSELIWNKEPNAFVA